MIAGGGYQSRANSGEGYPIAETFRNLGYNCFVLQRRVFPYGKEDIWMDLQRSLRYLKYHAKDFGFDSVVHYEAVGFSGGSGTVLGTVQSLYGDVQPTVYDPDYICDEIDTVNADFDAVLAMYGPNMNNESDYKGMITENDNLPDFFIAVGQNDMYGAAPDCLILANSLADRVRMEFHYFADAPHGFSLGIRNNNSAYWVPMADAFLDRIED